MKSSQIVLLVLMAIILQSCAGFNCLEGTGPVITEEIDLNLIKEIENNTSVDIELRYGQNQKIEVKGHRNHIELLQRQVSAERWVVDFSENVCAEDMIIKVTIPEIRSLEIDGSGDFTALTPFQGKDFDVMIDGSGNVSIDISAEDIDIDVDGSGDVRLNGYAEEMTVNIDGSGDVFAFDLEANEISVDSDGSGNVQIYVKETLNAKIKGSGNITYKGDPEKMEFTQKGSGSIKQK